MITALSVKLSQPELIKAKATAYCLDNVTASGEWVRDGICATGNPDYFGKTIVMYQRLPDGSVGELIGIYECKDKGCAKTVIDVWTEDIDKAQSFMDRVYEDGCKGNIYIQVIETDG